MYSMKKTPRIIIFVLLTGILLTTSAFVLNPDSTQAAKSQTAAPKTNNVDVVPDNMDSLKHTFDAMRDSIEELEEEKRIAEALQSARPKQEKPRLLFPFLLLTGVIITLVIRLIYYLKNNRSD